MSTEEMVCCLCSEAISPRVALHHQILNYFPEVYYPGVRLDKDGRVGHIECFIAAGDLDPPLAHAEQWKEWRERVS
jgi:hypothetical protein